MNVLEVFTGNPLNTPVGQRIDKATDGSLEIENWALNMEICDIINETDEGPKEAVRAIRKKISNSVGKDWRAITYCLVVLETCVKNCGRRFHIQVANKDFLHELVKIISPKNEPPVVVQEKILSLIQSWADAFRGAPDLKAVEITYQELKSKGIEFPATDLDQLAPIHTPKSNVEAPAHNPVTSIPSQQPARAPPPTVAYPAPVMPGGAATVGTPTAAPQRPTPEQMSKLRSDIDIVQGNCRVFNEMLNVTTSNPAELTNDTVDLMKELNRTCRQMQQRIVLLIEQPADEQITEVLLGVNDDLNNAFVRYDRLERFRSMSAAAPPAASAVSQTAPLPVSMSAASTELPLSATTTAAAQPPSQSANDQSLIDFGPSDPTPPPRVSASALAAHMDNLSVTPAANLSSISDIPSSNPPTQTDADEFDMFAQSRQYDASNAQHSAAATYSFQTEAAQSSGSLGLANADRSNPYMTSEPSATSSEFDQFLEERVAAGEKLPDKQPDTDKNTSTAASTSSPQRNNGARKMHKDDSENALFAL